MIAGYFRGLYRHAMGNAYETALKEIALRAAQGRILDCGAGSGHMYERISRQVDFPKQHYSGIEWNTRCVADSRKKGLDVVSGDLNLNLSFADDTFRCVFGLSVIEHLLNPCRYLRECYRVLEPGGALVVLTPNISTYFTAMLILLGKMPSSGPHPDSNQLLKAGEIFKVSDEAIQSDAEADTPMHRHLVVFSYRALRDYLIMAGFVNVSGRGFGLYPFPRVLQPLLERIDPYHCHQMVFVATKPRR